MGNVNLSKPEAAFLYELWTMSGESGYSPKTTAHNNKLSVIVMVFSVLTVSVCCIYIGSIRHYLNLVVGGSW